MTPRKCDVRFTSESGHCRATVGCPLCAKSGQSALQQNSALLDHLARFGKKRWGHCQSERLGRFEIDHEIVLVRLQYWQVRGFFALLNATDIDSGVFITFCDVGAVADQPTGQRVFTKVVDGGQAILCGGFDDAIAARIKERRGRDQKRADTLLKERRQCRIQFRIVVRARHEQPLADPFGRTLESPIPTQSAGSGGLEALQSLGSQAQARAANRAAWIPSHWSKWYSR